MSEQPLLNLPPVRQSIVRMSGEILAELIGLPASARVVAVSNCEPFHVNGPLTIAVKIEDEGLRGALGGCVIPDIHSRFTRGEYSVRQEWDGPHDGPGGYYQAAPPSTIRPDADKLASLLNRVSDFLFVNERDLKIYHEVIGAVAELRGVPAAAEQSAAKPPLTWGDVEKLTQDALKWHKEYAATAAGIVKKPLAQPGEQGGYAVPREVALHAIESGVLPPDAVTTMEPVESQAGFGPPKFILCRGGRMDGSRIPDPVASRLIFAGSPYQLYVRDGDVMRYQGDCDEHGNLLASDADTPAEPQADEPHKVQWRKFL